MLRRQRPYRAKLLPVFFIPTTRLRWFLSLILIKTGAVCAFLWLLLVYILDRW